MLSLKSRNQHQKHHLCPNRLTTELTFGQNRSKNKTEWRSKLTPNWKHTLPFAFSIFHLLEIDLEMDLNPELIHFNLIPPMHHYLHNATSSRSSCALNSKSTFKFCAEYKILPPPIQQKAIIPFVFPHNGLWIIVIWGWGWMEEKATKLSAFPSLRLCLFVMNNRLQMRQGVCLAGRWVWSCLRSAQQSRDQSFTSPF